MTATKAGGEGWAQFWKAEKHAFDEVMRLATSYFGKKLVRRYKLAPGQSLFDYGCGPGFLADYLIKTGVSFTGADINPFFVSECKKHHPASLFIPITTNAFENHDALQSRLGDKQFDYIILLSISQYFRNDAALEEVVQLLIPYMKQSGKLIIADVVDEDTSSYRDALSLFTHCIIKGKILSFFRFMRFVTAADYADVSKKTPLLKVSRACMKGISQRQNLRCEEAPGLTLHPTRKNYILTRP